LLLTVKSPAPEANNNLAKVKFCSEMAKAKKRLGFWCQVHCLRSAIPQIDLNNAHFYTKTAVIGHKKGCFHRCNTVISES